MSWRAISPVLVAMMCPACVGADQTSRRERSGEGSALSEPYAPEDVDAASTDPTSSTGEDNAPDEARTEEDTPERTGEAAQAEEGYPGPRSPWGDGAPDGHTYSGGPPSGSGKGYDYHIEKKPIGSGGNYPRTMEEINRAKERRERRALASAKRTEIQEAFAQLQSEARTGKRQRIGGGGSVDHNACAWTCSRAIAESCRGIQALCAGTPFIVLAPEVSIPCGTAVFAACIVGKWYSSDFCDSIVCAGVK